MAREIAAVSVDEQTARGLQRFSRRAPAAAAEVDAEAEAEGDGEEADPAVKAA